MLLSASSTCFLAVFRSAISCKSLRRSAWNSFTGLDGECGPYFVAAAVPERAQRRPGPPDFAVPHLHCPGHLLLVLLDEVLPHGLQLLHPLLVELGFELRHQDRVLPLLQLADPLGLLSLLSLEFRYLRGEGRKRGEPPQKDVLPGRAGSSDPWGLLKPHLFSNSSPEWKEGAGRGPAGNHRLMLGGPRGRASLTAQWVENPLQCSRIRLDSWVGKIPWRRDRLPNSSILGLPFWCSYPGSARKAGDLGSIPGLGRSPGEGKGYPL